jgi:hypothetical protein
MGLWHGVEYYETEKLTGEEYYKDWPNVGSRNLYSYPSIRITLIVLRGAKGTALRVGLYLSACV